jgi:hypothetical protein
MGTSVVCSTNTNTKIVTSGGYGLGGYGVGGYGVGEGSIQAGPIYKVPLAYYNSLFTSEWQIATKLLQWASDAWQPLDDMTSFLAQMSAQDMSLGYAIGVQLDMLGSIIGQSRTVDFQPSSGVSSTLDDDTYRLLLRATIFKLKWDGRIGSLYSIWKALFPQGEIVINDNQNMSATVYLNGPFSSIIVDLIDHGYIVPRPEGVLYNYIIAEFPMFGTDLNVTYIAGVDLGHIV